MGIANDLREKPPGHQEVEGISDSLSPCISFAKCLLIDVIIVFSSGLVCNI